MVSSMAQFGVFEFLPTANAKQMRSRSLRAARLLMRDGLHAQTAVLAGNLRTWRTTIILITGSPEDPQIEPHAEIKIAQGLVSVEMA